MPQYCYLFIVLNSSKQMARRYNRRVSEATRYRMSLAKKGSKNPMYGKKQSEDAKRKISAAMVKYWRGINP